MLGRWLVLVGGGDPGRAGRVAGRRARANQGAGNAAGSVDRGGSVVARHGCIGGLCGAGGDAGGAVAEPKSQTGDGSGSSEPAPIPDRSDEGGAEVTAGSGE